MLGTVNGSADMAARGHSVIESQNVLRLASPSPFSPCPVCANLVAYLCSDVTFTVRAYAYLGRHRSLDLQEA